MKHSIEAEKFDNLILEEESKMNALEEHTLDWYTFQGRVQLLKKVKDMLQPIVVKKEVEHKSPKKYEVDLEDDAENKKSTKKS